MIIIPFCRELEKTGVDFSEPVFLDCCNTAYYEDVLRRELDGLDDDFATLKLLSQELNVHSLRHTAASLMIAGGTDVATVAGILGHSQPSTTLDIYTHAFDKNKKAASAGLQGMLEI